MKWLDRVVVFALCLVVVLGAIGCIQEAPPDLSPEEEAGLLPSDIEQEIFDLVNEARVAEGLDDLSWSGPVKEVAMEHCRYMEEAGVISHDGFQDRASEVMREVDATRVGENVAVGYRSPEAFVEAWLDSEGHRKNIMDPSYKRTGIGYYQGYATQLFCD